ncbi:MAG: hypothetical protein JWN98_1519 [Abditibacteriota bacterium]|nr:hypothetical protein [Abditibacteriota bacterium]
MRKLTSWSFLSGLGLCISSSCGLAQPPRIIVPQPSNPLQVLPGFEARRNGRVQFKARLKQTDGRPLQNRMAKLSFIGETSTYGASGQTKAEGLFRDLGFGLTPGVYLVYAHVDGVGTVVSDAVEVKVEETEPFELKLQPGGTATVIEGARCQRRTIEEPANSLFTLDGTAPGSS